MRAQAVWLSGQALHSNQHLFSFSAQDNFKDRVKIDQASQEDF